MAVSLPIVLVFSASDPSGGAGMQADLLTVASLGCHPLSVVTAITVQDTQGVDAVLPIDAAWVASQARRVLEDCAVSAFKVGLIGSPETVEAIAGIVAEYPDIPLVLDPVLASGRGDELASSEVIETLRERLLPRTTLITPNSIEARRLARGDERDSISRTLGDCAARLLNLGCEYVLVTGAHEDGVQVINTLYDGQGTLRTDSWQRLPGEFHGSGCTLAAACAATMANGVGVADAVRDAQEYTWRALESAYRAGRGQLLPDRLFWAREVARGHAKN